MNIKNRSRLEILYDIVTSANPSAKKTHVMWKANISFLVLDSYLNLALEKGLIRETNDEDEGRLYRITPTGLRFISTFDKIKRLLDKKTEVESSLNDSRGSDSKIVSTTARKVDGKFEPFIY